MLANILLRSELVDRTFRHGTVDGAIEEVKSVRKMVRSSLYEVRHIIYDLRPMSLDDLGLVPVIKKFVERQSDYYGIKINFQLIGEEARLQQKYEIALFRLMQEALQNALFHAEASNIQVKLEILRETVSLVIKDNGQGFDAVVLAIRQGLVDVGS